MITKPALLLPLQEVVNVVGAQCLALLDALPSGAGLMAGHSWLAEAGGDAEDGGDGPVSQPSLPSLAAARPQGSASVSATPALVAAASGSNADAAALVAAVARGQDAREAARGSAATAGPQRQQEAGSAAGSVVAAAAAAAGTATQGVAQPQPQPQHQQQEAADAAEATTQGVAQPQPQQQQHQQHQAAGPALPPRPESESVGTQADAPAAEHGGADDGPDTDAHVLRRIEHWAKLQLGLAVLSVPAFMLGVWLSKRQ